MATVVATIVAAAIGLVGVLVTQSFLHRRWGREQDAKRDQLLATSREERRREQAEVLDRMAEQNNAVVQNAVTLAEVHRVDAEQARLLVLEASTAHTECRHEVAQLAGKVEELRARIIESERTSGYEHRIGEEHRNLKHKALNALTVSEGYVALVQKLVPKCSCHAFDALDELTNSIQPRVAELLAENQRIAATDPDEQGAPA